MKSITKVIKNFSSSNLKERMGEAIASKQVLLKEIKKNHGAEVVQTVTLD